MGRNCYCKVCGRPTDCSGDVCELCECFLEMRLEQLKFPEEINPKEDSVG